MVNEKACPTVPTLYTWDSGTKKNSGTSIGTSAGQGSLKALAQAFFAVPYERDKWDTGRDKAEKLVPEPIGRVGQTEPAGHPGQGAPVSSATVDGEPEDAPARYEGWCPGYWQKCMHGCAEYDNSKLMFCKRWNREHPEDSADWEILQ